MTTIQNLENRIVELESRNNRVESDKAWETSWVRRIAVMALTYAVVASYLHFVVHISPWINAVVPVVGFFLSGVTISLLKKIWLSKRNGKR